MIILFNKYMFLLNGCQGPIQFKGLILTVFQIVSGSVRLINKRLTSVLLLRIPNYKIFHFCLLIPIKGKTQDNEGKMDPTVLLDNL